MFPCSAILLSVRLFPTCTQRFWLCPVDFRRPYFHCNKFSPSYAPLPVARKRQRQIQSVALFLCGHYGEYLDDVLYISKRGKPRTIKIECYQMISFNSAKSRKRQSRKVVFYGRVSTEHEEQLNALRNQMQWYEELSRSYSQRDIINSYMDKGITGTQTNKRLEFMRMIDNSLHSSFGLWLET